MKQYKLLFAMQKELLQNKSKYIKKKKIDTIC